LDEAREALCPRGVRFTTQSEEALEMSGLDAIVVATPADSHRMLVEAALARSLAVLCEKPIAGTLEDADAMIRAASAKPGLLHIGHCARFDPRHRALHHQVRAGVLGDAVHLTARRVSHTGERDYYGRRTSLAVELAIHDLDLLQWLAGPIDRVFAESSADPATNDVAASIVATVRFRSGAIGTVESSWAYPEDCAITFEDGLVFVGSQGFARVDGNGLAIYRRKNARLRSSAPEPQFPHGSADAMTRQAECFLSSVGIRQSWPLALHDARAALAVALAIDSSVKVGRPMNPTAPTRKADG
jgi:predicted dehydrogenase